MVYIVAVELTSAAVTSGLKTFSLPIYLISQVAEAIPWMLRQLCVQLAEALEEWVLSDWYSRSISIHFYIFYFCIYDIRWISNLYERLFMAFIYLVTGFLGDNTAFYHNLQYL